MATIRPTKKQYELLDFVTKFIASHGYGPSYREIMRLLGYKSVSTVAGHIDNLIARGHLRKRDKSARSLEVVSVVEIDPDPQIEHVTASEERWLIKRIQSKFDEVERHPKQSTKAVDELYVLVGALQILGLEAAANACKSRLQAIINA